MRLRLLVANLGVWGIRTRKPNNNSWTRSTFAKNHNKQQQPFENPSPSRHTSDKEKSFDVRSACLLFHASPFLWLARLSCLFGLKPQKNARECNPCSHVNSKVREDRSRAPMPLPLEATRIAGTFSLRPRPLVYCSRLEAAPNFLSVAAMNHLLPAGKLPVETAELTRTCNRKDMLISEDTACKGCRDDLVM